MLGRMRDADLRALDLRRSKRIHRVRVHETAITQKIVVDNDQLHLYKMMVVVEVDNRNLDVLMMVLIIIKE